MIFVDPDLTNNSGFLIITFDPDLKNNSGSDTLVGWNGFS